MNTQFRNTAEPLLMMFTDPTAIAIEDNERPMIYDPISQIVEIDMRIVGTRSLRYCTTTNKKTRTYKTDGKNEIDDSKSVK